MKIKKNEIKLIGVLGVFLAAVLVTGVVISQLGGFAHNAPIVLGIELQGQSDSQHSETIVPGGAIKKDTYVKNTGTAPCYVRVRVDVPVAGGAPAFVLGDLSGDHFQEKVFSTENIRQDDVCWVKSGSYYYYRNIGSGDVLVPGAETPRLFTAVALNSGAEADLSRGAVEVITEALESGKFANSADAWAQLEG